MSENRIRITVSGISYSPMQTNAFALLLSVEGDSTIRIPVVIGAAEAQSIAVFIERLQVPRPLTHDLFSAFSHAFGIRLDEVFIYKFEDGIYSAEMTFSDNDRQVVLDARTSDAIAIAMRAHAPIYTTAEIVEACGIRLEEAGTERGMDPDDLITGDNDDVADTADSSIADTYLSDDLDPELENCLSDDDLQRRLQHFVDTENYEAAARVSSIINSRKK